MRVGRVFAHAGQTFAGGHYDVLVVGAGRLGLGAAFYLRRLAPALRVLVVEREGIPSESGASGRARGVWRRAGLPPEWRGRAEWVRRVWQDPALETGTARPHDPAFQGVGWAELQAAGLPEVGRPQAGQGADAGLDLLTPGDFSAHLNAPARAQLAELCDLGGVHGVLFDAQGGYGSAVTLALSYGYAAVGLGADLLLNTEARLTPGGAELRRLDVTPHMQVVVAQRLAVTAGHTVVAAGAWGSALLEEDLGLPVKHERAYVQFPRLALGAAPGLPVLAGAGLTLRPGEGGFRVLPPPGAPDPAGYEPRGARLEGVPVGIRPELLKYLLGALDVWPMLTGGKLDLGKTLADVPGTWEARPLGGWPLWERVSQGVSLLLGGPESDRAGLAVAYDLAAALAGVKARPWHR